MTTSNNPTPQPTSADERRAQNLLGRDYGKDHPAARHHFELSFMTTSHNHRVRELATEFAAVRHERDASISALLQVAVEAIRLVHGSQLGDRYSHEPCGECGLGGEGALRDALTKALGPGYTNLVWGNDMNADWDKLRTAALEQRE